MARVVTYITDDICIRNASGSNELEGICYDIWNRAARDLNITFSIQFVNRWSDMFDQIKNRGADVIMQAVSVGMTKTFKVTG